MNPQSKFQAILATFQLLRLFGLRYNTRVPKLNFFSTFLWHFAWILQEPDLNLWILAINTGAPGRHGMINTSVLLDGYGNFKWPEFTFSEGTEVAYSCSVIWESQMYVFGGFRNNNQVSRIDGCQLNLVAQLDFKFNHGACTNFDDSFVYLCFPDYNDETSFKYCYRSSGPLGTFQRAADSTHVHTLATIANNGG